MNERGNKSLNAMFIELEEIYFHLGSHLFPGCIFDGISHIQLYNDAPKDLPVIVLYCLNLNCSSFGSDLLQKRKLLDMELQK